MIQKLYSWYGKRNVLLVAGAVVLLLIVGFFVKNLTKDDEVLADKQATAVEVATVASFSDSSSLQLVGTVRSVNEATIQAEASGRATRVNVAIGDTVAAGQILATLENATQYASLLQAEGTYEAAQAGAAASNISVSEAENNLTSAKNGAIGTYRGAYSSVNNTVINLVDNFFSGPDSSFPGVRLSKVDAIQLSNQRKDLQTKLTNWQTRTNELDTSSDLTAANKTAIENTNLLLTIIDELTSGAADAANKDRMIAGAPAPSYTTALAAARSSLVSTIAGLNAANVSVNNAEESLQKAKIGGTNSETSAANASVKQALGTLRAAQANYEKTILRTPISGTVNEMAVKSGDFVNMGTKAALVANNGSLEVTTFVGESDRERLEIGQKVTIEGQYSGTITKIAPAVNQETKKIEVKIETDTDKIANGETVTISILNAEEPETAVTIISVPLAAVKFTAADGFMFTVEDSKLVANPVVLGPISGSFIVIESGIDSSTRFVVDARGLTAGQEVEVVTK